MLLYVLRILDEKQLLYHALDMKSYCHTRVPARISYCFLSWRRASLKSPEAQRVTLMPVGSLFTGNCTTGGKIRTLLLGRKWYVYILLRLSLFLLFFSLFFYAHTL